MTKKAPGIFDSTDDKLDLGAFKKKAPARPSVQTVAQPESQPETTIEHKEEIAEKKAMAVQAAAASGFQSRDPATKIDGRSLKRTGRTEQFNTKVRPEVKEYCARAARERGDDGIAIGLFLEQLLDAQIPDWEKHLEELRQKQS